MTTPNPDAILDTACRHVLATSAARESVWAKALRMGLLRHGPTPTFDQVVADLGYRPGAEWAAAEGAS